MKSEIPKFIESGIPAIVLAPMEGVTNAPMRALQTKVGVYTYCVSEFVRVSQEVLSPKTLFRLIPELSVEGCTTPTGAPVQVQILGGNPERLAESARVAVACGARGIDLNFGCPAPTVNRHDGGATLLQFPERIRAIVSAVRGAVPSEIPVSAKLRLGWDDISAIHRNADEAALGGASWITIHARTKMQGYAPPVFWEPIGEVRKRLSIPVVANGDIWSFEDFLRCREVTGCQHFMLGRGGVADPSLSHRIARELGLSGDERRDELEFDPQSAASWLQILTAFEDCHPEKNKTGDYFARKTKQWMAMSKVARFPGFDVIKRLQTYDEILGFLKR